MYGYDTRCMLVDTLHNTYIAVDNSYDITNLFSGVVSDGPLLLVPATTTVTTIVTITVSPLLYRLVTLLILLFVLLFVLLLLRPCHLRQLNFIRFDSVRFDSIRFNFRKTWCERPGATGKNSKIGRC